MQRSFNILSIGVLCAALAGCELFGPGEQQAGGPTAQRSADAAADTGDHRSPDAPSPAGDRALALLGDRAITWSDLSERLLEAYGGQMLEQVILDRQIERRLAERGITVKPEDLQRERAIFAGLLDAGDADEAHRVLDAIRQRRGWTQDQLRRVIWRSAALRNLVAGQAELTDRAVQQAYEMRYGPKYQVRLIVVPTRAQAQQIIQQAAAGESFSDLAAAHSTDISKAQGGLLSPFSPLDPTYPDAVRKAAANLKPGEVSIPVDLENGYAVLKLERIIPAQDVALEDVREELTTQVRHSAERLLMDRLARTMLEESTRNLIILDPTLEKSWRQRQ